MVLLVPMMEARLSLLQVLSMLQESNAAANNYSTNTQPTPSVQLVICVAHGSANKDGKRPCTNCILSYVKKNKANHVNYVDLITEVKCVYSLAKKRGPKEGRKG